MLTVGPITGLERRVEWLTPKEMTPPEVREVIYARNLERYGDELGPTVDWLREHQKTWDQIVDSAVRVGGRTWGSRYDEQCQDGVFWS